MDPIELIKSRSRRLVVVSGTDGVSLVYQIQRYSALDLLRDGAAVDLPGLRQVAHLRTEEQAAEAHALRLASAKTPEQRAAVERTAADLAEDERRAHAAVLQRPEAVAQLLGLCDGAICASVVGVGVALLGVAAGLVPAGVEVPQVAEQLSEGVWLRPLRYTRSDGPTPIDLLSETERVQLGTAILQAWTPTSVAPLRDAAGAPAARSGGHVGAPVRAASDGPAGDGPGDTGARAALPAGGGRGEGRGPADVGRWG